MSTSSSNTTFSKLYFAGVAGWFLGSVLLLALARMMATHEIAFDVLTWSASYWWIAFALGLVALVLRGVLSKAPMGSALLAYVLPMALIGGLAGLCIALFPDQGFQGEFLLCLPIVLVFYVFGFLWLSLRKDASFAFARAVLPPIVGGLIILSFATVPVFTGNSFRYRNAFGITVARTATVDSAFEVEAILEIRKPGNYQFAAPRLGLYEYDMMPDLHTETGRGKITWGEAGAPQEGKTGSFPLRIRWEGAGAIPKAPASETPQFINTMALEVYHAGAPETAIYTVVSELPEEKK
jgi:hypothetical protein